MSRQKERKGRTKNLMSVSVCAFYSEPTRAHTLKYAHIPKYKITKSLVGTFYTSMNYESLLLGRLNAQGPYPDFIQPTCKAQQSV